MTVTTLVWFSDVIEFDSLLSIEVTRFIHFPAGRPKTLGLAIVAQKIVIWGIKTLALISMAYNFRSAITCCRAELFPSILGTN
jgi:hypothetical protein